MRDGILTPHEVDTKNTLRTSVAKQSTFELVLTTTPIIKGHLKVNTDTVHWK